VSWTPPLEHGNGKVVGAEFTLRGYSYYRSDSLLLSSRRELTYARWVHGRRPESIGTCAEERHHMKVGPYAVKQIADRIVDDSIGRQTVDFCRSTRTAIHAGETPMQSRSSIAAAQQSGAYKAAPSGLYSFLRCRGQTCRIFHKHAGARRFCGRAVGCRQDRARCRRDSGECPLPQFNPSVYTLHSAPRTQTDSTSERSSLVLKLLDTSSVRRARSSKSP